MKTRPRARDGGFGSLCGAAYRAAGRLGDLLGSRSRDAGKAVDRIFAEWDKPDSPGFAVAVIENGHIVHKRGYGMADLDHNIPITSNTVFHAASLAKQFTAMSILLLVEQKRLTLGDDVRRYVPELPPLPAPITIADMLHHVSGIRDQWVLATMAGWRMSDDVITEDDVVNFVVRMKALNFLPRQQFLYSNTGYTLAALIVERRSNRDFPTFTHERIFRPLGMANTEFTKRHGAVVKTRAYGYRKLADRPFELRMPNYDLVGPTNLLTTVEDLARWNQNFESKKVGGDAALSAMQTPAILANGRSANYGLGLFISTYRGLRVIEHDGRDAGYRSHFMRFPDQRFAVICLGNLAVPENQLPGTLARRVADTYLADQLTAPIPQPHAAGAGEQPTHNEAAAADGSAYLGRYYSEEIDTFYHVERRESSTVIVRHKYPPTVLKPLGGDSFAIANFSNVVPSATVRFTRDGNGHVSGFVMDSDRMRGFEFTRA